VLQFPDGMSTEDFLEGYWQKSSVFMPQALPADLPELSADELGWLATLDDVESRIIFSLPDGDITDYRVEHGPFDEKALAALPQENWTLLVQDVEKHLPDFRRYISGVSFIPDWRVDDLMVSFAAPGGSVGPHRDNYDVFLCQGTGQREWRIAAADADLRAVEYGELSLVEPFDDASPATADNRDVLYLPPGIAHWGIATDSCMTYSIGMRAPTSSEFTAGVSRIFATDIDCDKSDELFYEDPDLSESEAEPGLISERAIRRALRCFKNPANLGDADFAMAFGCVVSDVKAWLAPEPPGKSDVDVILKTGKSDVQVHGMARLAYFSGADGNFVFANGFARSVTAAELKVVRRICAERTAQTDSSELFTWLAGKGAFDLPANGQDNAT